MFKTHLAVGALSGLMILKFFHPEPAVIFSFLFLFASILPDIDTAKSFIGHKLWPVSSVLSLFVRHRGFLHSIWLPLLSFSFAAYFGYAMIGAAFALGYLVHILSDSITQEGVPLFTPLFKRRIRGFIKTGGTLEYVFLLFVCIALGATAASFY